MVLVESHSVFYVPLEVRYVITPILEEDQKVGLKSHTHKKPNNLNGFANPGRVALDFTYINGTTICPDTVV